MTTTTATTTRQPRASKVSPKVRHIESNPPTVAVQLFGKHGEGREVLLNERDWTRIAADYGEVWNVISTGGYPYVATSRREAYQRSRHFGTTPVSLAKVIMRAKGRDRVVLRDGDALNLQRSNLKLVKAAARKKLDAITAPREAA